MQVANQADISGAGGRWNGLQRSHHPEAPHLVAFRCSDCSSNASALVWLAMGDLRYARFSTNGQDLAARAGE